MQKLNEEPDTLYVMQEIVKSILKAVFTVRYFQPNKVRKLSGMVAVEFSRYIMSQFLQRPVTLYKV